MSNTYQQRDEARTVFGTQIAESVASLLVLACAPMTRPILIATCLVACLACGAEVATTPAAATTTPGTSRSYDIVLHRPLKAGDKFRVVVDASEQIEGSQTSTTTEEAAIQDIGKDLRLSLVGTLSIREVDEAGRAQSALLVVEEFKSTDTGAILLPAGAKIDAIRGAGDFSLMVNDEPRPDLLRALRLAFPLHRPGSPLGDELFGSKTPRQIGDSWAFSRSLVADRLVEDGYVVRDTAISGDARLVGTTTVGGIECLELAAKLRADQATVSEQWALLGVGSGELDITLTYVVPVDKTLPLAMEEAKGSGRFEARVEGDTSSAHRDVILNRHRKALYTKL
jgi:hypothetical protein